MSFRKKHAGIRQLMTRTLVAVTSVGAGLSFVNPCWQKIIPWNSAALICFKELSQPFSLASERKCWMSSKVQLKRQQRHLWAAVSNVGPDAGEFTKSVYTSGGQKFMLLGVAINLSGTLWSAADRIRKLILRGQCGTVRFHAVLS